jgi:hypothetical protein
MYYYARPSLNFNLSILTSKKYYNNKGGLILFVPLILSPKGKRMTLFPKYIVVQDQLLMVQFNSKILLIISYVLHLM